MVCERFLVSRKAEDAALLTQGREDNAARKSRKDELVLKLMDDIDDDSSPAFKRLPFPGARIYFGGRTAVFRQL